MIRVGPAGWIYRDWAGIAYPDPPPRGFDPLAYLAKYFQTIEVNSSFYGPPTAATAAAWVRRVEAIQEFRFTAKLWRRFTHERDEAFTRAEVHEACRGIDPLHAADRLGALLLQFPWSFRRTDPNRQWLDDVTSTFSRFPLVIEVRHESWNVPDFYAELVERGIGFVNIDQPLFRQSIGPGAAVTSPVGYVRVHGRNHADWFRKGVPVEARYNYLYSAEELKPWVARTRRIDKATRDTYLITNNHYRGKGLANALMVRSMLDRRKVDAPPDLVEAYAGQLAPYVTRRSAAASPRIAPGPPAARAGSRRFSRRPSGRSR